jgi:hypothetical protein
MGFKAVEGSCEPTAADQLGPASTGLDAQESNALWWAYLECGGNRFHTDVADYLGGTTLWPDGEHNALSQALQEALWDVGSPSLVQSGRCRRPALGRSTGGWPEAAASPGPSWSGWKQSNQPCGEPRPPRNRPGIAAWSRAFTPPP